MEPMIELLTFCVGIALAVGAVSFAAFSVAAPLNPRESWAAFERGNLREMKKHRAFVLLRTAVILGVGSVIALNLPAMIDGAVGLVTFAL